MFDQKAGTEAPYDPGPIPANPESSIRASSGPAAGTPFTAPKEVHPLAELISKMGAVARAALAVDIGQNGLRVPITLFENKILDGRARYEACLEAGVQPHFETSPGMSPWRL